MTLKQIKEMFQVGQQWRVSREGGKPLSIVGNTGNTVLPANDVVGELRTVAAVKTNELVFNRANGGQIHSTFPKAAEVIESKEGFLKFKYDNGLVVTMIKT